METGDAYACRTHDLKTWPQYFQAIEECLKRFELRREDGRRFEVGDTLCLREWDPARASYTGRKLEVTVIHMLRDFPGLEPGYVLMSITTPECEGGGR